MKYKTGIFTGTNYMIECTTICPVNYVRKLSVSINFKKSLSSNSFLVVKSCTRDLTIGQSY